MFIRNSGLPNFLHFLLDGRACSVNVRPRQRPLRRRCADADHGRHSWNGHRTHRSRHSGRRDYGNERRYRRYLANGFDRERSASDSASDTWALSGERLASGFCSESTNVVVALGKVLQANFSMIVDQIVHVSSEPPLLGTQNGDISTTFDRKQIESIPNPGNDVTFVGQLARCLPSFPPFA